MGFDYGYGTLIRPRNTRNIQMVIFPPLVDVFLDMI
jgi:hypothetical protein